MPVMEDLVAAASKSWVLAQGMLKQHDRSADPPFRLLLQTTSGALGSRCFTSGAFVYETPPGTPVHAFFQHLLPMCRTRLSITHFITGATGAQKEFDFIPPILQCGVPKHVALLYSYTDLCGRSCCYVKLETHKALSIQHGISAFKKYVLKKKTPIKISRRESEPHKLNDTFRNSTSFCRSNKECARSGIAYDTCGRVGDEVFVPAVFSNRVLLGHQARALQ